MRGTALDMHVETADTLARGDDLAALAGRLGDEHRLGMTAELLDQPARGQRADFLVRGEEEGQRALSPCRAGPLP